MLLKEVGYDAFLAEKIAQGRAELEAGEGVSLEEAKIQVQSTIEKTAKDLNDFERSVAYA